MSGDASDPELAADLVGAASARLTAAGVPREERIGALRLLSILSMLADTDLRVRRPLAMVASEFDLPAVDVERWLDDLIGVGLVRLDGAAMVLGGREPARQVRITLHDFLDAAQELDATRRRRVAPLRHRPAGAILAAAALVALAFLGPAVLDDPSTPVSSSRTGSPVVATTAEPRPITQRSGTTTADPLDDVEPLGPVAVATTSTTILPCPTGAPVLEVTGTTIDEVGQLAVDGIARNPVGQALTVTSFTLLATIDGQEITAPGSERDLVVPAHGTVRWQATLPFAAPAGTLVRATLGNWSWQRADARVGCSSQ